MLTAEPSLSEMIMISLCYSPHLQIPSHFSGIPKKAFDPLILFTNKIQPLPKKNDILLFMHIPKHEEATRGIGHPTQWWSEEQWGLVWALGVRGHREKGQRTEERTHLNLGNQKVVSAGSCLTCSFFGHGKQSLAPPKHTHHHPYSDLCTLPRGQHLPLAANPMSGQCHWTQ